MISYFPKITVQSSMGGIAPSEGLACGSIVLTAMVIAIIVTAPQGAILMNMSYKKLLTTRDVDLKDKTKISLKNDDFNFLNILSMRWYRLFNAKIKNL